ncbi:hypothetical protein [Actinomyces vulturis]|uniref:hypothetical protein n=1 Tax=Actinomyces vulturis TaxID=1857645 RepID=UPI00082A4208|nr:hypothetical protein [Actinomyces vulturis]
MSIRQWLLAEHTITDQAPHGVPAEHAEGHPWWKVMCLTGVDYFSTLGYQPAIALLAAGAVAPIATLVLVIVTLCGALPVYAIVAKRSHDGAGSIRMLERLIKGWPSKVMVLFLLGFACTDYLVTITLSSSDAAAHIVGNSLAPSWLQGQNLILTLIIISLLALLFLKGFTEAIGLAVAVVVPFIGLNVFLIARCWMYLLANPHYITEWQGRLSNASDSPLGIFLIAVIVFPRLALGMSGFETGVAVMPQISAPHPKGELAGRIVGTRKLLATAAVIMSMLLVTSSIVVTTLIPEKEVKPGGEADGRALAYLAHHLLGSGFGTVYDLATILILALAGASAMAGILNVIPRYLPRYGMAPAWLEATRPLVLVVLTVAVVITIIFDADVDAQGAAYATGVLVLMTSAAFAVFVMYLHQHNVRGWVYFGLITAIFIYTTLTNMVERPSGLKIALILTALLVVASVVSRAHRSYELRTVHVDFDQASREYLAQTPQPIRLIAHKVRHMWTPQGHDHIHQPDEWGARDYDHKIALIRRKQPLVGGKSLVFIEVDVQDTSAFTQDLHVTGRMVGNHFVMTVQGVGIPNALAAVCLAVRDMSAVPPRLYVDWSEGTPVANVLRFLLFGQGQVGSSTHEILRRAEKDPKKRPVVIIC